MKSRILKYYTFFPLFLLCIFYFAKAINFPIHDFSNYYFGGKFLADSNFNATIYFPYEFNKSISNLGYQGVFASYAPNTPFLALLFLPFSFLSVGIAKVIFNCIATALFLYSIFRLIDFYKINFKYVFLIPILFFIPIKNNLLFGQVYFLLFFFFAEFWMAYEKNKLLKSAIFLSLAILLKVFPILFISVFLLKKQYKLLLYTFGICFLLIGISVLFTGFDIWIFYIKYVLPKASNGEIATSFVTNYQSVFMFLKELLVFDVTENPNAFFNISILFSGLVFGFKIALIAVGFYVTLNVNQQLFVFSFWILLSILISPYGSTYTFILLIFVFLALIKTELSNLKKGTFLVFLFLINNIPVLLFINNPFPFSYIRLLFLLLFFGLFISTIYSTINWKLIAIISIIPLVLFFFLQKSKTSKSSYLLNKNAPILIYDYKIENNKLTFFYWNEKGENSKSILFKFKNNEDLKLRENEIFYKNKQLTFDKSNKLKPILIDNKFIVFLTDFDRGIGFYGLKKIEIE